MNTQLEGKQTEVSGASRTLMTIASAVIGGGVLWYTWLRYNDIVSQPDFYWYNWVQLVFLMLLGFLCIWATFLFIAGKPSSWTVFKTGLSMIPLLLFSNLIILALRVMQGIFRGNVQPFWARLIDQPRNLLILLVVLALILLGYIDKFTGNKNSE